jgi:hypothetical protein
MRRPFSRSMKPYSLPDKTKGGAIHLREIRREVVPRDNCPRLKLLDFPRLPCPKGIDRRDLSARGDTSELYCLRLREDLNLVKIYVKELITCTYILTHFLCFLFFFLSSSLLELLDEDESSSDDEEPDDEDPAYACANSSAYFFSMSSFGASLRNWRRSSVRAPRPILVKKLMLNLAFCTESRGKTAPRYC